MINFIKSKFEIICDTKTNNILHLLIPKKAAYDFHLSWGKHMVIKFFELNGTTRSGSLSFSHSIRELNTTCILWKIEIVKEQI